jgi:hypothetical protein
VRRRRSQGSKSVGLEGALRHREPSPVETPARVKGMRFFNNRLAPRPERRRTRDSGIRSRAEPERMAATGVWLQCRPIRSPNNQSPFRSLTSSARRPRWKSHNPRRAPNCLNRAPTLWFPRDPTSSRRPHRKKSHRHLPPSDRSPAVQAGAAAPEGWLERPTTFGGYLAGRARCGALPSA